MYSSARSTYESYRASFSIRWSAPKYAGIVVFELLDDVRDDLAVDVAVVQVEEVGLPALDLRQHRLVAREEVVLELVVDADLVEPLVRRDARVHEVGEAVVPFSEKCCASVLQFSTSNFGAL